MRVFINNSLLFLVWLLLLHLTKIILYTYDHKKTLVLDKPGLLMNQINITEPNNSLVFSLSYRGSFEPHNNPSTKKEDPDHATPYVLKWRWKIFHSLALKFGISRHRQDQKNHQFGSWKNRTPQRNVIRGCPENVLRGCWRFHRSWTYFYAF